MSELTIHEKLIDIQQKLKVPKDKRNEYSTSKFMYRNLEAIEEAVKPMLKEHQLTLAFSDDVVAVGDRVFVKATVTLSDGKSTFEVSAFAQHATDKKGMDEAQLTGSCSSYARKYAAGGLFLIDETKDADSQDNTKTVPKGKLKVGYIPSDKSPATDFQRSTMANLLRQRGIEGSEAILEYLQDEQGVTVKNGIAQLTEIDAQLIIESLDTKGKQ